MAYSKQQVKAWAERMWKLHMDQLAKLMGLDAQTATIKLVSTPAGEGGAIEAAHADAATNTITLNYEWYKNFLDVGNLMHEGAHMVGDINREKFAGLTDPQFNKMIEAAADAVRYRLGFDDNGAWEPSLYAARLAALSDSDFKRVTQSMAEGTYSKTYLRQLEGKKPPEDLSAGVNAPFDDRSSMTDIGGGGTTAGSFQMVDTDGDGIPDTILGADGAPTDQSAKKNLRAAFEAALSGWGIATTDNLQDLVHRAVENEFGLDRFYQALRKTPEYRHAFPGIFEKDGTMKMTETQYLAERLAYTNYASQYGIGMSDKREAWLFRHDVTSSEFADRAVAYQRLDRNKELYSAFRQELIQGGTKPGEVDRKGLFKFVMGEGNKAWYDLWQDAVTRNAAVQAGITFKKGKDAYTNLGQGVIERISNMGLSEEALSSGFLEVEDRLRTGLSLVEANLYGLTKKDVVRSVFGGKGAGKARERYDRAVTTAEAFEEERATQDVGAAQGGGAGAAGGSATRAQA